MEGTRVAQKLPTDALLRKKREQKEKRVNPAAHDTCFPARASLRHSLGIIKSYP